MSVPNSSGQLRTTLDSMQVGDYIVCNYNTSISGKTGSFSNLGGIAGTEIPVSGSQIPNGSFYFVKVEKGLLIADRVLQTYITWDEINSMGYSQCTKWTLGGKRGCVRLLTGGVAYASANGSFSTSDSSNGAFPTNNEWDRYIVNNSLKGKITPGDDAVWHWSAAYTWTQDTPASQFRTSDNKVCRGKHNLKNFTYLMSQDNLAGFRPVFQYSE